MAKIRSIKLSQNADDTFTVLSFSNTAQLSIGQVVNRSRLEYWAGLPDVRTVVVPAPREEESDLDETSEVARVVVESELEAQPEATRVMGADFIGPNPIESLPENPF